ncbi:DNA-3-methyladenine glycosylase I [Tepidamorphus sp. 3E244]|uniref:DNA-3-methyladenine glycosylase I n=1 Tax=Tepidamorphus sp. 3E244 TaxID=3385498 RepID=UPI0038FCAC4E
MGSGLNEGLIEGPDGKARCFWHGNLPDYLAYHDSEWGYPVGDDTRLFEKMCLEGFQSGLSWLTILRKRENFRKAFAGFDISKVAAFDETDMARLLDDAGIVRHRGKIEAAINNAQVARGVLDEYGSFAAFLWQYEPSDADRPKRVDKATLMANPTAPASVAMSKALKKRGFRFVGPTTMYALMQAMGMVNDHIEGCCVRDDCEAARAAFKRPTKR